MMKKQYCVCLVGLCLLVFPRRDLLLQTTIRKGANLKANETALVLIEFQNEMLKPGGKNYEWLKPVGWTKTMFWQCR